MKAALDNAWEESQRAYRERRLMDWLARMNEYERIEDIMLDQMDARHG